jgi:hypothetical protein
VLLGGASGFGDRLSPVELGKTFLEFKLFRCDLLREDSGELLVEKPELIKIHGYQV